jgi:hypothetical protein
VDEDRQNSGGQTEEKVGIDKAKAHFLIPNFKIPAYRQAGKCQMNVKVQNWILKRVHNDTPVMPNLFRHLI